MDGGVGDFMSWLEIGAGLEVRVLPWSLSPLLDDNAQVLEAFEER